MKKLSALLSFEFLMLALIIIYDIHMISLYGSSWDNIAAFFNSLTMIGRSSYYEILREPLIQLLIIPIVVLVKNFYATIEILTALLSVLFFLSVKKLSNSLKVKGISAYALALTGIVIGFMSILNATDIFGAITVILALAFYYEGKKTESSIFFGLAFLAKFTNLIFLPYMLVLFDGKDRIKAIAIALTVNVPWLLANYILYGNPFYGYILANSVFSSVHVFNLVQLASAIYSFFLLTYQFILVFLVILIVSKRKRIMEVINKCAGALDWKDYTLIGIVLVEYIYVGSAQSYVAWLGYPLYVAFLVATLKVVRAFQDKEKTRDWINRVVSFSAIAVILISIVYAAMPYGIFMNMPIWFSKNIAYNQSLNDAYSLSCKDIYSNAWPYQMVYNTTVQSIFNYIEPYNSCLIMFNTTNVGVNFNVTGYKPLLVTKNYSIYSDG